MLLSPGMLDMPGIPPIPDMLAMPGIPPIPDMLAMPGIPDMPAMPGIPDMPAMPGIPPIPGIPGNPAKRKTITLIIKIFTSIHELLVMTILMKKKNLPKRSILKM